MSVSNEIVFQTYLKLLKFTKIKIEWTIIKRKLKTKAEGLTKRLCAEDLSTYFDGSINKCSTSFERLLRESNLPKKKIIEREQFTRKKDY